MDSRLPTRRAPAATVQRRERAFWVLVISRSFAAANARSDMLPARSTFSSWPPASTMIVEPLTPRRVTPPAIPAGWYQCQRANVPGLALPAMQAALLPHRRTPRLADPAGPPTVVMTQSVPTSAQSRMVRFETIFVAAAVPCCDQDPHTLVLAPLAAGACAAEAAARLAGPCCRFDQAPSAVTAARMPPKASAVFVRRN